MERQNLIILVVIGLAFTMLIYQDFQTSKDLNVLNTNLIVLNDFVKDVDENTKSQNVLFGQQINNLKIDQEQNRQDMIALIQATQSENQQDLQNLKEDVESSIKKIKVESSDFSAIVNEILQSIVSIVTDQGQGSGVFLRTSGLIVTNEHVIRNAKSVGVLTFDKEWHRVSFIGSDPENDIALLQIETEYPHLRTADSDDVLVGEKVIALGNPSGLDFTVTEGIVSAVDRYISGSSIGFIQTDVPINPGNSGGPLVNKEGRIIGINNFKITGPAVEGLGFAIPSNVVDQAVNDILDRSNP